MRESKKSSAAGWIGWPARNRGAALDRQRRPLSHGDDRAGRHALLAEGSTTTQGKYPKNIRGRSTTSSAQPPQRPDRRSDARRSLHLRPRLLDAVPLASAGRRRRRRPPRRTDRRAHPGRRIHRPGPNRRPAAGAMSAPRMAAVSTKARPRSRKCKACAAAATPAFPCRKKSSTKPSSTSSKCTLPDGGVQYSSKGGGGRPAITAAAIACLFNAGDYDSEYVPKLLKYCETNLGGHLEPGLRPLALRPLLLRPGEVPRRGQGVGELSRQGLQQAGRRSDRQRQVRVLEPRLHRHRSTPPPST